MQIFKKVKIAKNFFSKIKKFLKKVKNSNSARPPQKYIFLPKELKEITSYLSVPVLAQLVEQLTVDVLICSYQQVAGSIPANRTIFYSSIG